MGPPWGRPGADRLATLLESWRAAKERRTPAFTWLRSLRPPPFPLGGAELACLRGHGGWVISVSFDWEGRRIVSGSLDNTVRVWDAATGDCLEVIQGSRDVAAIAAPASVFPWRAMSRNLETVIEPASGGEAVACFPAAMYPIATHPSGRIWAGSVGNHLYLIRLEGDPDLVPRGGDS